MTACALAPQDRQRVRLFSGGAADAPAPKSFLAPRDRVLGHFYEDDLFEKTEYFPVAIKARDRDAAEGIELCPFIGAVFEERAVSRDIRQPEFAHTPVDALADLSADLPKPLPSHAEPGERTLEELDTIAVLHNETIPSVALLPDIRDGTRNQQVVHGPEIVVLENDAGVVRHHRGCGVRRSAVDNEPEV